MDKDTGWPKTSEGTTPQAERPDLEELIVLLRGVVSLKELKWSEDEYEELQRLQKRGMKLLTKYEREFTEARAVAPVETRPKNCTAPQEGTIPLSHLDIDGKCFHCGAVAPVETPDEDLS